MTGPIDLETVCTRGISETLVRAAGEGAGVLDECLSLFSNEGDACGTRCEDRDEDGVEEGAGLGVDLEAFLCTTAGTAFTEGDDCVSILVACWAGAR